MEAFGAGTAAVVAPVKSFLYKDEVLSVFYFVVFSHKPSDLRHHVGAVHHCEDNPRRDHAHPVRAEGGPIWLGGGRGLMSLMNA